MRPIEFRAWDKTNIVMRDILCIQWHYEENTHKKLMSFAEYFDFDCKDGPKRKKFIRMYPSYLINTPNPEEKYCGEPTFELMQFTGLLDKNGKKIFEGDIIRNIFDGTNEILFKQGMFCIEEDGSWFPISQFYSVIEVIGNIYENPDLLDGKQNE